MQVLSFLHKLFGDGNTASSWAELHRSHVSCHRTDSSETCSYKPAAKQSPKSFISTRHRETVLDPEFR